MSAELVKPPGCTCQYPRVVCRNMNGHHPSCPIFQAWRRRLDAERAKNQPPPDAYANHRILAAFDVKATSREEAGRLLDAEIDRQFRGTRVVAYVGFEAER